ncbi:HpcH/HpaI aldolase family protein [Ralstonia pseudosolanacearum]|uniref:HpcH/HpaI aldolase family protein n=1 Tax=Ralstonia pseudosolanacearum TaxID=1310165 RepID=UPI001FF886FE|nr:aldolase/citrate lyase family protein [Ralstonia pseudosolanacearum]MDO3521685.1 aldolase/citrate lyase family protein [Ralstonia pseudosolanacearum]MDO3546414.1 aldolase/citrate lyase family protein [Ralstonia pseudosolanacearum]MDO3551840.1 aldolase/citrate lyase family protein [Ralstonia pseudosolanacearum]MDO3566549.1 aldolase/citrate lyase family protein [Ralstonia pseudosolanacearum]MDO3583051.1 aldolase/citrate lyase family protein [Ralstonia pseudosolanacearum]
MSAPQSLKARLRQAEGRPLVGLFCSTPAPLMVELIAAAGYDFVVIDLEHTLLDGAALTAMLLAARAGGMAALVRVAAPLQIVQVLDAGAQGVVIPRVRSVEEAREAVAAAHHAPLGRRGLNATCASRFGRDDLARTVARAAADTLVVAMIEDRAGLDALDAIAAVDGVDVLLGGAADLSQDLGMPWQTGHADVRAAIARVAAAARRHGKVFCALPRHPDDIADMHRTGVRLAIAGDDRGIARRAMAAQLQALLPDLEHEGAARCTGN